MADTGTHLPRVRRYQQETDRNTTHTTAPEKVRGRTSKEVRRRRANRERRRSTIPPDINMAGTSGSRPGKQLETTVLLVQGGEAGLGSEDLGGTGTDEV
ncbi:hypothetical protein NDU88_005133 [Pleurodeles waltl]|uniref:Uncharacterized protein n=1 Tax=Pleurodeles waltl TaxID=8319 RepID=A0AAV7UL73_PLEWA|nr:hypothetical protein NDU88_005133 [Pleurodeles waltl]